MFVQAKGNDFDLVLKTAYHVAGGEVVGRCAYDTVDGSQEPIHHWTVQQAQRALADDIGVVGQDRRPLRSRSQVQQVAEWPREVVVDDIGPLGETSVHGEGLQRHPAGSDLDVATSAIDLCFAAAKHQGRGIGAQRQQPIVIAPRLGKETDLPNYLFDTSLAIGKVGSVDM